MSQAKYFPGLFASHYPLQGSDWLKSIPSDDLRVFVDIGLQAANHGRAGGQALVNHKGHEHMQRIGRIGAIATNSKKFWNRLLQEEMYKLGL